MAFQFSNNVSIAPNSDKIGWVFHRLKTALLASGLWQVYGSGQGSGGSFAMMGQTAGPYDLLTVNPLTTNVTWTTGSIGSFSRANAWIFLQEITSGRVLGLRRDSGAAQSITAVLYLTAPTSGASATNMPAGANGGSILGTAISSSEVDPSSGAEWWLQIGYENALRAGNVAPWYLAAWSRTSNLPTVAGHWSSMVEVDPGISHPFAAAFGAWAGSVGTPATADGGVGSTGSWRGGDAGNIAQIEAPFVSGLGSSPAATESANSAGTYTTERPRVVVPSAGYKYLGRLEHWYLNRVNRQYPTTYGVATSTARITLGHLIGPWPQNVAPNSSP